MGLDKPARNYLNIFILEPLSALVVYRAYSRDTFRDIVVIVIAITVVIILVITVVIIIKQAMVGFSAS